MSTKNSTSSDGYEYEVVGTCPKTGKPILAPKVWNARRMPRPYYATCTCCKTRR
jgi:hypothetical protein